jgi:capsular exopolysaccharide synthesis family protein
MANSYEQFNELNEETINWRELFERYIVYWKWIVASAILFGTIGYLYNRAQPDTYKLNTSVLIVDPSRSGGMNEMSILKQLDLGGMGNAFTMVNNENEVLKSVNLMKKVVSALGLHTSYYTTHFLKSTNLYNKSPYLVQLDSLSLASLEHALVLEIIPGNNGTYRVEGTYNYKKFTEELKALPAMLATPAGAISISLVDGRKALYTVKVTINSVSTVARYLINKALSTSVSKQVDVVNLSVSVSNPQLGEDILNTMIQFYNQDAIDQLNRSANNTREFIDDRLFYLTDELSTVERSVEDYKQENELTDIPANAQLFLQRNNEVDKKQMEVETQLSLIRLVEDFLAQPANKNALIPNLGLTDVGLLAVINQYNELLMTRERVSGGSSADNPALIALSRQLDATRQAIRTSIANSRKGLELTNRELTVQNRKSVSQIRELPRKEREFVEIKRQQQVKESLYLFLLQKREEASLSMALNLPKGTVLSSPDHAVQTGPRSMMIMAIFLLLGVVFPIAIVFIRDLLNTSITNRPQLEKLTKVPILSELGHNSSGNILIEHASVTEPNTELFRLLRTKLQFTLEQPHQKVIMVTSTEPGEGKSFVSINLALSLSMTGKKTILLGLDLRKPQLRKHLQLLDDAGMSTYLSGQEPDYHSLIQHTPQYPDLDIIAAGVIPPNPNELLINQRLDTMIEALKRDYDFIVIDTAPVGAVSDTFLIDRVVDITLYIVRMEYSDKRNMDYLNHIAEEGSLKRPYVVINDMNMESKYYYHRGYSYGYGKYYGKHKKE